ncbi:copper resistance protein CopC [Kineosporia sp. J2-2]|uniref:Copper resistance protein CopC n=1 Tax=Kineosporia corallincola TaxID=2835133 RepID=A0ABS5TF35_9ACTN|nr:copper resistance protein CopC [Kineosporia corallincola]MBT0769699.1 copper resistance protein CopC [Kineosporia corallincola]
MLWLRVSGALRAATVVTVAGTSLFVTAGAGFADTDDGPEPRVIGFSPARQVVQFAPYAVSVTFSTPLRESGASMSIRTVDGEVGTGKVVTRAATLRRSVIEGAPNGVYTIEWEAVAKNGRKMAGTFGFTAGHPNDDPLITGVPAASSPESSPESSAGAAGGSPAVKDPWADDGDAVVVAPAPADDGSVPEGRSPYRFPLLAFGLGSLLVIASGLVSRRHRRVERERPVVRTRRGVYSV